MCLSGHSLAVVLVLCIWQNYVLRRVAKVDIRSVPERDDIDYIEIFL